MLHFLAILSLICVLVIAVVSWQAPWIRVAALYYCFQATAPVLIASVSESGNFSHLALPYYLVNNVLILLVLVLSRKLLCIGFDHIPYNGGNVSSRDARKVRRVAYLSFSATVIPLGFVVSEYTHLFHDFNPLLIRVEVLQNSELPWLLSVFRYAFEPLLICSMLFLIALGHAGKNKTLHLLLALIAFTLALTDFRKGTILFLFVAIFLLSGLEGVSQPNKKMYSPFVSFRFLRKAVSLRWSVAVILLLSGLFVSFTSYGIQERTFNRIVERIFVTEMTHTGLYVANQDRDNHFQPDLLPSVGKSVWSIPDNNAERELFFQKREHLRGERYGNIPVLGLAAYVNSFGWTLGIIVTFLFYCIPILIYRYWQKSRVKFWAVYPFEVSFAMLFLSIFGVGSTRIFSVFIGAHPQTYLTVLAVFWLSSRYEFVFGTRRAVKNDSSAKDEASI